MKDLLFNYSDLVLSEPMKSLLTLIDLQEQLYGKNTGMGGKRMLRTKHQFLGHRKITTQITILFLGT